MITADTITDDQIRALMDGAEQSVRIMCRVALNDGATYLRADVVRDARGRCAATINAARLAALPDPSATVLATATAPGKRGRK